MIQQDEQDDDDPAGRPEESDGRSRSRRRPGDRARALGVRVLRVGALAAAALVLFVVAALGLLQIDAVATQVVRTAASWASSDTLSVRVERASGSWIRGLELAGVEARAARGGETTWSVRVDTVEARYRLGPLLSRRVEVSTLRVSGVDALVVLPEDRPDDGEEDQAATAWNVSVGEVSVDLRRLDLRPPAGEPWSLVNGRLRMTEVSTVGGLHALLDTLEASFRPPERPAGWGSVAAAGALEGGRARIDHLSLRSPESDVWAQGVVPLSLEGTAPEGLDLDVVADPLHLADVGPFLPAGLADSLRVRAEATLRTAADTLFARAEAEADVPGRLSLDARVWGPRGAVDLDGRALLSSIDLRAWGLSERALVADADFAVELAGLALDAAGPGAGPHGLIEGGAFVREPEGTITLDAGLEARAAEGEAWRGAWQFDGFGAVADGTLDVALGEVPAWGVRGGLQYADTVWIAGAAARVDVEGRGFGDPLDVTMLVRLDSLATRPGLAAGAPAIGPGTLRARLDAGHASAELELDMGDGRMDALVEGDVETRTGRIVRGRLTEVDVAALLGDTVPSTMSAEVDGALRSLEPLEGSGGVRVGAARYGSWTLDSLRLAAEAEGEEVRLSLTAAVPDTGRVVAGARILRDGDMQRLALDSLVWHGLDVRVLTGAPDTSAVPRTNLAGVARGQVARTWPDVRSDAAAAAPPERDGPSGNPEDDGWAGLFTVDLRPSTVGAAVLDAGAVRLDLHEAGADVTLSLEAGAARLSGEGGMDAIGEHARFSLEDLTFREIDLSAFVPEAAPPTELNGHVEGAWSGPDPASGSGRIRAALQESRVGATTIHAAEVSGEADRGLIRFTALLEALGGRLSAEAEARIDADRPRYAATGRVDRPDAGDGDGHVLFARFGLDGAGTRPDSARGDAWVEVDSARWAGRGLDAARLAFSLADGAVHVDTVDVRAPGLDIGAGGWMPLRRDGAPGGEVRLAAAAEHPELLGAVPFSGPLSLGDAEFELVARGTLEDVSLEARGRTDALLVGTTTIQAMGFEGAARRAVDAGWTAAHARLEVDRVRTPNAPLERLEVGAELVDDDVMTVEASATIDGDRDVSLGARVAEVSNVLGPRALTLERLALRLEPDQWVLASPAEIALRDGVRFDGLVLASDAGELRVDGGVTEGGDLDLEARLTGFEIAGVADLLGFPAVRGRVSASLALEGTTDRPELSASVESRLRPEAVAPATLRMGLLYREDTADLEASLTLDGGPRITADASVPYVLARDENEVENRGGFPEDAPLRAVLVADAFPLARLGPFLPPAAVRDLQGRLDGSVEVGGTGSAPRFDGRILLADGAASLPPLGARYTAVGAHVTLRGSEIVVDSLGMRSGGGTMSAAGRVAVPSLGEPTYDLSIRADGFEAMGSSAVQATISGQVDVRGRGLAPEISGVVEVDRADLYLSELMSATGVDEVALTDEQWGELARVFGYQRPSDEGTSPPIFEAAALDLEVRLGRASWVRQRANPRLALQFSGEMSVQKEANDSLQLVGSVEAVPDRSWVEQFGRRFAITQGDLTFQGTPLETLVEVEAQYEVPSRDNPGEPEVVLILGVMGTPEDLSLELSSTPPLEASDMVSYLVTGRPAGQSLAGGGDGSLAGAGGALALGQLSGAVETYAREAVGLDVIEITTDGMDGMTLLAGRFVSPELYVGVRQPVTLQRSAGDAGQRAPDSEIEVELQAVRWLLLNLRAGGRRGVEFYVRSRIAYE